MPALAADAAEPRLRLVKTIGDTVMFVAPEPVLLLETVLALMEAAEAEGEQLGISEPLRVFRCRRA